MNASRASTKASGNGIALAKDEGKSIKTVQEAYIAAIKKMKKFLKTPSNLDS